METLGNLLSQHRYKATGWPGVPLLGLSALSGVAALAAGLMGVFTKLALVGSLAAVAGSAVALWFLWDVLQDERLAIHEDGILKTRRSGIEVLRWEDVDYLIAAPRGEEVVYTLGFRGDRQAQFRSTCHSHVDSDIGVLLRQKTQAVLWPQYLASLDQGGKVKFGTIVVGRRLLVAGDQEVLFKGLNTVVRDGSRLVFTHNNGTETRIDTTGQPNVHLIAALAAHYRR